MGSRTVWILLVFVLLLGGVAFWQLDREKKNTFASDVALFDGVRPERVQSVRIDHLELGLQISIERDENGVWQIVDPLAFPAESGVLDRLLEVLSKNRAIPVAKADLASLSLSPPRAVLEFVEKLPTGERKSRLELGAKDLDGKHVYARVDGKVVRTLLNLDSTLERDLSGWRQRRILNFDPAGVVEVRRSGKMVLVPDKGVVDLAFEAGTTDAGWRATKPWNAAIDPDLIGAMLANACYLQARSFLADSAAEVSSFGFDQPDLRLELGIAGGSEVALLFKHVARTESWTCMREDSMHVFRVDDTSVVFLALQSDGFVDTHLTRVPREEVQRIELRRGEASLSMRRDGAAWRLGAKNAAGSRSEVLADSVAVLDLLGALESGRVARFLVGEERTEFTPGEPALALSVLARSGESALEFGAPHEASPGVPGRLFRRVGDDLVGVVEERIAQLASRDWSQFVDRQMVKLPELAIASIELTHKDLKRKFVRDGTSGRWSPAGADVEAPKAFLKLVERLLSLRADVAVDLEAPFDLQDPWNVVVVDGGSVHTVYSLGRLASDPKQQGFDDGHVRGIVTSSGLIEDLERIE